MPWHEWIQHRCENIKEATGQLKEGRQLLPLLASVGTRERYDNIVAALRPLCSKSELIQRWVDTYRKELDAASDELEEAKTKGLATDSVAWSPQRFWATFRQNTRQPTKTRLYEPCRSKP